MTHEKTRAFLLPFDAAIADYSEASAVDELNAGQHRKRPPSRR